MEIRINERLTNDVEVLSHAVDGNLTLTRYEEWYLLNTGELMKDDPNERLNLVFHVEGMNDPAVYYHLVVTGEALAPLTISPTYDDDPLRTIVQSPSRKLMRRYWNVVSRDRRAREKDRSELIKVYVFGHNRAFVIGGGMFELLTAFQKTEREQLMKPDEAAEKAIKGSVLSPRVLQNRLLTMTEQAMVAALHQNGIDAAKIDEVMNDYRRNIAMSLNHAAREKKDDN